MGFFDTLKSENVSGTRLGGTSAKSRIRNALNNQLDVINGKKIIVADNELKSWWDGGKDGVATWKVSNFTIGRTKGSKDQYKSELETALSALDSGGMDDVVENLQERLDKRAADAAAKAKKK